MSGSHGSGVLRPVPRGSTPTMSWVARSAGFVAARAGTMTPAAPPGPPGLTKRPRAAGRLALTAGRLTRVMLRVIEPFVRSDQSSGVLIRAHSAVTGSFFVEVALATMRVSASQFFALHFGFCALYSAQRIGRGVRGSRAAAAGAVAGAVAAAMAELAGESGLGAGPGWADAATSGANAVGTAMSRPVAAR